MAASKPVASTDQDATIVQCRGCESPSREPEIAKVFEFVAECGTEKAADFASRIANGGFVEIELPYSWAVRLASGLRQVGVVAEVMSEPPPSATTISPARYHFLSFCWGVPGLLLNLAGGIPLTLWLVGRDTGDFTSSTIILMLLLGNVLTIGGSGLLIVGLGYYARAKGHPAAWGCLGVLGIIGLIVLACLPDRSGGAKRDTRPQYIKFFCPHCRLFTEVDSSFAGEKGPCRGCGKQVTVPHF